MKKKISLIHKHQALLDRMEKGDIAAIAELSWRTGLMTKEEAEKSRDEVQAFLDRYPNENKND